MLWEKGGDGGPCRGSGPQTASMVTGFCGACGQLAAQAVCRRGWGGGGVGVGSGSGNLLCLRPPSQFSAFPHPFPLWDDGGFCRAPINASPCPLSPYPRRISARSCRAPGPCLERASRRLPHLPPPPWGEALLRPKAALRHPETLLIHPHLQAGRHTSSSAGRPPPPRTDPAEAFLPPDGILPSTPRRPPRIPEPVQLPVVPDGKLSAASSASSLASAG